MTLAYLDTYETIFQFWNKGLTCFLSNPAISERTGVSVRQVKEALTFLESKGELTRKKIGLKRYLVQPEKRIEIIQEGAPPPRSNKNTQVGAPPPQGGRSAALQGGAQPPTEYKEVEYKELSEREAGIRPPQPTQLDLNLMCLNHKKCQDEFSKKFGKLDISIDELLEDCVMHYYLKEVPQKVSPPRFLKWIRNEHASTYSKKETNRPYKVWSELEKHEKDLIGDYQHNKKHHKHPGLQKTMTDSELLKAEQLIQFLNHSHGATTL